MYVTDIEVNDHRKSVIFYFDPVDIFLAMFLTEIMHFLL